jgi:hypothetical protein
MINTMDFFSTDDAFIFYLLLLFFFLLTNLEMYAQRTATYVHPVGTQENPTHLCSEKKIIGSQNADFVNESVFANVKLRVL